MIKPLMQRAMRMRSKGTIFGKSLDYRLYRNWPR